MLSNPKIANNTVLVSKTEGKPGGKKNDNSTKCFTHGRITINTIASQLVFGSHPPLRLPAGFTVKPESEVIFSLIDENRQVLQERRGEVKEMEAGVYVISGRPKPKGAPARKYQFRAYFTHQGVDTDDPLPVWLAESRQRQRILWNRAAYQCRQALRACSTAPKEDVREQQRMVKASQQGSKSDGAPSRNTAIESQRSTIRRPKSIAM